MPTFRYVVVDVFTDTPLTGNQLAVFTDAREIPEVELQRLAREMKARRVIRVPYLDRDVHDLDGLLELERYLFGSERSREALAAGKRG